MYTALDTSAPSDGRPIDPNGGPAGADALGLPSRRSDDAYLELKTRVLRGEFALNLRLVETRLAQQLGLSRTPVREALTRLAAESLLEPHPEGGFQPRVPNTEVIRELYEVRASLELTALQRPSRAGRAHSRTTLEELQRYWQGLADGPAPTPSPDFVLVDESFHVSLASAAGNRAAVEFLQRVNERIRVIRMHDFLDPRRIELTIEEHLSIVGAVLRGDLFAAESAFTAHLQESMNVVEERAHAAIARMATGGWQ